MRLLDAPIDHVATNALGSKNEITPRSIKATQRGRDNMDPPPAPRLAPKPLPFIMEGDDFKGCDKGYETGGLLLQGMYRKGKAII